MILDHYGIVCWNEYRVTSDLCEITVHDEEMTRHTVSVAQSIQHS